MYLTIGETKLLVGQYGEGETEKLELNFEYAFASYRSYRRFAQVIVEGVGKVKIKLKAEFSQSEDCLKLAQLLLGVEKLSTPANFALLRSILTPDSGVSPEEFIKQQADLIKYFA